ncbi:DUF7507 domain-containing protein, partial [Chelativorans xinjiangense]|uniref:DUF7507 domain-containing protein n=1 Tax=Chelativorans xinjiangense TaxID=2681485 RepID=UPI00135BAE64
MWRSSSRSADTASRIRLAIPALLLMGCGLRHNVLAALLMIGAVFSSSTTAHAQAIWETSLFQDFGQGAEPVASNPDAYLAPGTSSSMVGEYFVLTNPSLANPAWQDAPDHTTGTGYMVLFNADYQSPYYLISSPVEVPGATYRVSYWAANAIIYDGDPIYSDGYIGLTVEDQPSGGTIYATGPDNSVPLSRATGPGPLPWVERTVSFQLPVNYAADAIYLNFFNTSPLVPQGNDIVVDDIRVEMARARISGQIYVDNNANGVFDAGDETLSGPLPYVAVVDANNAVIDFVQIAADGTYLLQNAAYSTSDIGQKVVLLSSAPSLGQVVTAATVPSGYGVVSETPNPTYGTTGAQPLDGILNVIRADSATGDHPDFNIGLLAMADLAITKDDGATTFTRGSNVIYTIVVSNDGPADAIGAAVNDPLPTGTTTANWTCGGATGGAICGAASGTGAINTTADLPAGSSVTYTLTLTVPAGYSGVQLTNTATVAAPVGVGDPDTSNNTASDTNAVSPPQPSFGACDATLYLGQNNPTGLFQFDTASNPFVVNPVGPTSSGQYNAIAMHPTDGYIYGVRATTPPMLVRVGSDGSVVELGTISGLPVASVSGEIGPDGTYYVATSTTLYRVNLETMSATSVALSQSVGTLDMAWHNGLLYTAVDGTGLFAINPANGNVTAIGLTGVAGNFGGMFGATNGVFGSNNSGGFYRFDLTTGAATLISDLQGSGSNDGAKCVTTAVGFPADLSITKTDGNTVYSPGTDVTYTIVVTNDGPFGVQGATISDPLPAGITTANWTCAAAAGAVCGAASGTGAINTTANIPLGGTVTYTLTMSVPADFTGDLVNTATVTNPSDVPDPDPSSNTSTDIDEQGIPSMTIEKTGTLNDLDGDGLIDLGETINYSFLVTNTGNVTLTDVTVNDPLLTVDQVPQTLAPGGTFTFTATYTPTQADIDNGSVENTATGTGTDPGGNTYESPPDSATVPPDQAPALTIEKTGTLNDLDGDDLLDPGETISFSFLVTNTGTVTQANVTVNDPMVTVDQGPQTLAPGESFTFTATYTPTQADIDNGSVTNTASGTGTDPNGGTTESPPDTVTVPPDQTPGMTIEKTGTLNDLDGDGLLDPGETIGYSFLVRNTGNVTVTNVTVNDPLVAVDQGPQTLAPGGSFTFTATYTPTQADIDNGSVTNTATGTGTDPNGGTTESPPDTVTVPPDQTPGMTIEKTGTFNDLDGDGLLDPGETISYSFLVTNTGNVTMTDVTVNDPLVTIDQDPQTLAPGASFTFTATYTPTQADIDAGSVENTATGTGTDPSGNTTESPPDTVTVPPDQASGMTIEKTGTLNDTNGNGLIDFGETISYSFLVTNIGNVTLSDVTVNDPLLTVDQDPQTLAPGASFTFTAAYTPTQADIDEGSVVNTATATATGPAGTPRESPPDTVTIPPLPASLLAEKTGAFNDVDSDGHASIGDTLTYTVKVTNDGGRTVTNVWPVDAGPTFNGRPGTNALSQFQPSAVTLAPGASQTFTATYVLSQGDIDNAAGITDSVENSATARGEANGGEVSSDPSTSTITTPAAVASDVSIAKIAGLRQIRRGERAPFTIRITNHANRDVGSITVTDTLPSGFRYVDGSATVDGVAVTPVINGLRVRFENIALGPNAEVAIRLQMLALSSAGPGEHVNRARVTDATGTALAPE